ncbi:MULTISPECIES: tyrosine-protein phosphatase [unclassified Proteiniphilum]|jgi:protein-tyrosine phosphatase|uniref:tyrosine-protein phosphatase n=1 Tax=unclassified Proteiniphilum TaxID=2622718 RepID=UPI002580A6D1|nr:MULTISPECIES: tyrosine-protein phosphatase [unclassified Proteiniphilum]
MSTVKITSVVEKDTEGDFLLKWEVSPDQEGNIDIYSSLTDSSLTSFTQITSRSITDQVLRVNPTGSGLREYFILRTGGVKSGVVANRAIDMNNIKNFRDIGGYYTTDNQQVKWGQIYRSADLSNATLYDQERIRRLNIKTVIDFRSERAAKKYPILIHPSIRKMSLPLNPMDAYKLDEQMKDVHFDRSDAIHYVQEEYVAIVENHKVQFGELFDILTNDSNYPVLLTGSLGKDGVGMAAYFILYAIGVPEITLEQDYMLSNMYIDPAKAEIDANNLSESMQEAVTAMLSVNRAYLNYAIDHIKTKYGSVDNYLEKELRVTQGKRNLLKKYLLYRF